MFSGGCYILFHWGGGWGGGNLHKDDVLSNLMLTCTRRCWFLKLHVNLIFVFTGCSGTNEDDVLFNWMLT